MKDKLPRTNLITSNQLLSLFLENPNNQEIFLEIIDYLNYHEIYFDSVLLIPIFKVIPTNEKISKLELFIRKCTVKKVFAISEILAILENFNSSEDKINGFILLLNSSFFPLIQYSDIPLILTYFNTEQLKILDLLFEKKLILPLIDYQIKEIILSLPKNLHKELLYYFRKKIPEQFNDMMSLLTIQAFDQEELLEFFEEIVINDDKFDEDVLFKYLGSEISANLSFTLIDLYVGKKEKKYSNEAQNELFEKVKKYIVDYGDFYNEPYPNGKIIYSNINLLTSKKYRFNHENFNKFIQRFGYEVYHFLDCINIIKLLALDEFKFAMIMQLFDNPYIYLDQNTLNDILNSFYQREFLLERKDEYTIYGQFEQSIREQNVIEISQLLTTISNIIDLEQELHKYNLNGKEFIQKLLTYDNKTREILHNITNRYIMICRERYINLKIKNAYDKLPLVKRVEKNLAKKEFFLHNSLEDIIEILLSVDQGKLNQEQYEIINNHNLLTSLVLYKISPKDFSINDNLKKYLSVLESILNILWEENQLIIGHIQNPRYIYHAKNVKNEELLGIIAELDIEQIENTLLNNQKLYYEMLSLFKKYKFIGWGNTFNELAKKIDLSLDTSAISGIINYFYVISLELKKEPRFSLTKLISYGNCYSSVSNKFAYLFGEEDYKLICANGGNYKAPAPKNKRLELAVNHIIDMYNKEYITIPSYEKDYILKYGKLINVVVGNSTSMINLTVGERTQSCLRICGMFYELYRFIIKDKSGFNIIFYDETGTFISRVSGIRNGNTIFLNELRDSTKPGIKNNDLVETIKLVANDLINISKNSSFPIDNVIISPNCAMSKLEASVQYIGNDIFENKLYNLPFNYDVNGYAILLASKKEGQYTTTTNSANLPLYRCCDDKIIIDCNEITANKRFIQLLLINELLNGKSLDKIEVPQTKKINCCTSSDKFIIYKDSEGQIGYFILDKYKNDQNTNEIVNTILQNFELPNKLRRNR